MNRGITINTHPGEILKEEVIKAHNLTLIKAAELLKVSRSTLSNIINSRSPITPNIAVRIATVFGGNAALWMRLQSTYELRETEKTFTTKPIDVQKL